MKIAICAKDNMLVQNFLTYFAELRPKMDTQILLYSFSSPKTFFDSMDQGNRYDLILLDVESFGTETAYLLREKYLDDLALLIYVVDRRSRISALMETNFFTFLQKPVFNTEFQEKVGRACALVVQIQGVMQEQSEANLFTYKVNRDIYQVKQREIMYLQSDLREIWLHLWSFEKNDPGEVPYYYGKLDAEERKLPTDVFFRVHQSYLVNARFIRKVTGQRTITLLNGIEIPISTNCQKKSSAQIESLVSLHRFA